MRRQNDTKNTRFRASPEAWSGCAVKRSLNETEEVLWFRVSRRLRAREGVQNRIGMTPCSGRGVHVDFENLNLFHQPIKLRRVGAEDAGDAHVVVIGFEVSELVAVGDEPEVTV